MLGFVGAMLGSARLDRCGSEMGFYDRKEPLSLLFLRMMLSIQGD